MKAASGPAEGGPLQGVRVLDMSRFIAGPYAGQILGQMGAEVVKIEEPGAGDPMRSLSKYSTSIGSAHFLGGNACKKGLTLDLRAREGREVLLRLLDKADILIENFRPGVMQRLDLDTESLLKANPRLIVASVSGFGQTGPWKDWPAYDLIAQAVGGGMSLTGWPGERPVKMGVPIGDIGGSIYAVIGILAALHRRHETGRGELVDISMMDVQLSLLNYHAHYFWLSGEEPQPEGDAHPNITPYQGFDASDRPFVVAVYGDPFWPGFCRAIERPELTEDQRFATNALRQANKDILQQILNPHFADETRAFWLGRLQDEGVPAAPINSVGEAVSSEQAMARDMNLLVSGPDEDVRLLGTPVKLSGGMAPITAPPVLGADTDAVLAQWGGYDSEKIRALRAAGII